MTTPLVLDARGRRCPLPIIDLARRIGEIAIGDVLVVEADDPAARPDVQAWCRMRGHSYLGERPGVDGTPGFLVRRER